MCSMSPLPTYIILIKIKKSANGYRSAVHKGVGIYDLYFLNNNKYLKSFDSFEDKISLALHDFVKIYNSNAHKIFPIMIYEHKKFYDFSTSKLLANFRVFDRFPTIKTTHKESCIKFSKLFGHPKIFYRHFKKKNLHKNRKFQWSINNSKKVKIGQRSTFFIIIVSQTYRKSRIKYEQLIRNLKNSIIYEIILKNPEYLTLQLYTKMNFAENWFCIKVLKYNFKDNQFATGNHP
ncbi:hypothetical protein AGLY_004425 [Aphis glycines]|uniref:Uncharacterized protein n=1 Tax=Aphis glycines TaxID=307491 RepID=A0A6G0TZE1_APHGL|nr:hypothetical protein AGLY_004425 [Aphis glycines]